MTQTTHHPGIGDAAGEAPLRGGSSFSRPAALIGGATALIAVTAIATTLIVKPAAPVGDPAGEARSATLAAQALLTPNKASGSVGEEAPADKPAPVEAAPKAPAPQPVAKPAAKAPATAGKTAAVSCASCGVVEAVTPVQQKGEGSGVGAVGGAVVGGLLGNQMGSGGGKKAMTVIGAVGGGLAGNEIEKRQRATTVYQVKVRMDDGSTRTVTQSTAPTVGQKVTVEGQQVKARA